MAGNKYLTQVGGVLTEVASNQSSAGASDAGKIPALDPTGRLDATMMPVGSGSEIDVVVTSEALAAGDFVNLWASTGVKARKADATVAGKSYYDTALQRLNTAVYNAKGDDKMKMAALRNKLVAMRPK